MAEIKIGYMPTKRRFFSGEDAFKYKGIIREAIGKIAPDVEFVDLEATGFEPNPLLDSKQLFPGHGLEPYHKSPRRLRDLQPSLSVSLRTSPSCNASSSTRLPMEILFKYITFSPTA